MNNNCYKTARRLNELLDERRPIESDDVLAGHLRQCRKCRRLANSYDALLAGAAALAEAPLLPASFTQQTVALAIRRSQPRASLATRRVEIGRWRALFGGAALAASMLLCLSLLVQDLRRNGRELTPPPTAVATHGEMAAVFDSSLGDYTAELTHAQMWQATGRGLAEIPVTFRRVTDQYERIDITDKLRPVAVRLGATLEALSRMLPEEPTHSEMLNGGTGACGRGPTMHIA